LKSLGVHEHWNSAIEKKYSRNLGTGNGIELVYLKPADSGTAVRQPAQQILSQTQKQFRVVHAQSTMVEFSSTTTGRYVIVDAMGKTKMTGLSEPGQNQITIASWPKGNYYIRYFSDNGLAIDRITVK
jgi:hypothetical protein